jgi:hypothetical protein
MAVTSRRNKPFVFILLQSCFSNSCVHFATPNVIYTYILDLRMLHVQFPGKNSLSVINYAAGKLVTKHILPSVNDLINTAPKWGANSCTRWGFQLHFKTLSFKMNIAPSRE